MKALYILSFFLLFFAHLSATIHVVMVRDFEFSPALVAVSSGDTVRFTWESGTHPTESDNVMWTTFTISSSATTHDLVLTSPAIYGYHCSFHGSPGSGMFGSIVVSSLGSIAERKVSSGFNIYPNPFEQEILVESIYIKSYSVKIYDLLGNLQYSSGAADLSTKKANPIINKGIYLVVVYDGSGKVLDSKRVQKL